jgi:hypothetical protein
MLGSIRIVWDTCRGPRSNCNWAGVSRRLVNEGPDGLLIDPSKDFCRYLTGINAGGPSGKLRKQNELNFWWNSIVIRCGCKALSGHYRRECASAGCHY